MWRSFWRRRDRRRPIAPADYLQTVDLMEATDDPAERRRLGQLAIEQFQAAHGRLADRTVFVLSDIEDAMRGTMAEQLGATNDMLGELLAGQRRQEAALHAARAEFQALGERLSEVESKVAEHDHSRDASIAERRELRVALEQLNRRMDESADDRAEIHSQLERIEHAIADMRAEGG